jgi:hypothetical protein
MNSLAFKEHGQRSATSEESSGSAPLNLSSRTANEILALKFSPDDIFMADGLLAAKQGLAFLGPGGVGKSRLGTQVAICTILGQPFLGLPVTCAKKRWLIIQAENSNRRLQYDLQKHRTAYTNSEWAGAQFGMSGVTVDRLISSVTALRKLQKDGSIEAAESLHDKINASINAGYNEGIRLGVITKPESKKKAEPKPRRDSKTEGTASKAEAQPEKPTEPSAYTTTGDLPQIENHALAMRHLDLLIEYVEDLGGDNIKTGHREEWQESMQSLTDALRKMGIIED